MQRQLMNVKHAPLIASVLLSATMIFAAANNGTSITPHLATHESKVAMPSAPWLETSNAKWIWPAASANGPNQYVQMLQTFELNGGSSQALQLAISADSNYAAWLNGELVNFGQWSNLPDDKTYDVLDLTPHARTGLNRLCIVAYHQGQSSSTYRKGAPGAVFAVNAAGKTLAVSGADTLMRPAPDYVSGPVPHITGQLGFSFEHHGNKDDGWLSKDYTTTAEWKQPTADEQKPLAERPVRPRPIPKLILEPRLTMRVVSQGVFNRTNPDGDVADAIQSDALSFRELGDLFENARGHIADTDTTGMMIKPATVKSYTGTYIVLDAGHEEAGLLDLELDAPAGTIVDAGYGEHLEDLRVRASVGGRNFAVRHVTPEGHHTFVHPFLRLGGRYVQLHITPPADAVDKPIYIKYAGLRPTPYPVKRTGVFKSPDSLHNKIWEVSRHTLELCMHEHYEDCPWREQALYAGDARIMALAGYYCFGNYDFVRESIGLLGQSLNPKDGFLELCAPAEVSITIPSFSLVWILMLDDYLTFSGDREFVKSQLPIAHKLIETLNRETSGPIVGTPRGPRMWNFYEWAPGMDGAGVHGNTTLNQDRLEAPLNLFYLLSLDAMARVSEHTGQDSTKLREMANDLRTTFSSMFWDKQERAFRTAVRNDAPPHFAELTQALAIIADVVPPGELEALRERLASDNNGLVPITIGYAYYKFEALMTDRDQYAARVFELIARDWGYMLSQGSTSFWETIDGAKAFGNAGSLCHGWSGIPVWYYGAHVLGVRPTAPGFEEFVSDPVTDVFTHAEGVVPTPGEPLVTKWSIENGKLVQTQFP